MVITKEQRAGEVRSQMRGGNGDIAFEHILQGTDLPPKCRVFSVIKLVAGASIGTHTHEGEAEFYYMLSGEARAIDDDTPVTLKAGDVMLTPSGHSHSVENLGKEDAVLLAVIVQE